MADGDQLSMQEYFDNKRIDATDKLIDRRLVNIRSTAPPEQIPKPIKKHSNASKGTDPLDAEQTTLTLLQKELHRGQARQADWRSAEASVISAHAA